MRWQERVRELWRDGMPQMGSSMDNLEGHALAENSAKLAAIKQYCADCRARSNPVVSLDVIETILAVKLRG